MTSNDYLILPTQTQLVSRISHLIGFSSSFIFLSGTEGSGRSSVCQQLMNDLDANLAVGYVELHPDMELARVRERIVLQLIPNAVFDANEPLNETLSRLVTELSRPRLLIVDDADSLASDWAFELWQWLAYVDELYPSHKISVLLSSSACSASIPTPLAPDTIPSCVTSTGNAPDTGTTPSGIAVAAEVVGASATA